MERPYLAESFIQQKCYTLQDGQVRCVQLQGFTKKGYRPNAKIREDLERLRHARTGTIVDGISAKVLEMQGIKIEEDSSSFYDPTILYEKLSRYSPTNEREINLNTMTWDRAFRATFKMFAKPKGHEYLTAITDVKELYNNLDLDKSSGATGGNGKRDDFWYAFDRELQVRKGIKAPNPCLAGTRTQLGSKVRLVWRYPYEMTIMEERFAVPLIRTFLRRNTTMAFGKSKFELGGMIDGIDKAYGQTRGLDFSQFDSTVPRLLIQEAFKILGTWFTHEQKNELGWDNIVHYFIYTPIVMPDMLLYTGKRHGVPSGSFFTQMIDSVVNTMVQFWLSFELGYSIDVFKFKVLGDDVIITIPKKIKTIALAQKLSQIGMIINVLKTKDYAHFLGATWINGVPYRNKQEMYKKLKYPERWRLYPSKDRFDRWALGVQLIMQFCYAYANAWEMLPQSKVSADMSRIDYMPMFFADCYEAPRWNKLLSSVGWMISNGDYSVDDMKTKLMTELILA